MIRAVLFAAPCIISMEWHHEPPERKNTFSGTFFLSGGGPFFAGRGEYTVFSAQKTLNYSASMLFV